jgi:hypothetical protein
MTQERKALIEQITRRHVAGFVTWSNLHESCAKSSRCLAAHPDDPIEPGEDGWDRLFGELREALGPEELTDEQVDEDSELFSAAFTAEWKAQIKPCK